MSVSESLESLNSCPPREDIIQQSLALFQKLKDDATLIRDALKAFNKKYVDVTLSERLLDPRPHAVPWFEARGLKTPCDLEAFTESLAAELATNCRICHSTRTVTLTAAEAALFGLQEGQYKWLEILLRLPTVFQ